MDATTRITLLIGSRGPHQEVTVPAFDGAASAPLLIESPAPGSPGVRRRVSAAGAARARTAAP